MQAGQIGQALGIGASKNLGLQEAERAASEAGGDPVKLAFSLAKASMAAPEMQRSLGQIYEQLLSRTSSEQMGKGLSGGQPQARGIPGSEANPDLQGEIDPSRNVPPSTDVPSSVMTPPSAVPSKDTVVYPKGLKFSPNDIDSVSHQYLMEMRPDLVAGTSQYGRIPTYNFEAQSNLRPEEEGQIRQNLQKEGYNPKTQDSIIEKLRTDIQAQYREKLQSNQIDATRQKEINDKWATFKAQSDENLMPIIGKYSPGYLFGGKPRTANDLKNKYFQYAGNLPINLTPEQMHAQAGAMLQNDVNRLDALAAIPGMPFIRNPMEVDNYLEDNKEAYKSLYKEGFYESLKEDAVAKGMGLEELHQTIWGDQTDKGSLLSVSSLKAPPKYLKGMEYGEYDPFFGEKPTPNPNYPKEREKYINQLSTNLSKIKPEDDLILLRAQALNNGALEKDFNDSLKIAQEKGLKLSPFQNSQLQEVRIPRKRPLWEIFDPKTWRQWMNLKSGKR